MPNRTLTYTEFKKSYLIAYDIPNTETKEYIISLLEQSNEAHVQHLNEDINAAYCFMLHAYKEGLFSSNYEYIDQLGEIVQHSKEAARLQRLSDNELFKQCPVNGHYNGDKEAARLLLKKSRYELATAGRKIAKLKEQIKFDELHK